VPPASGKTRCPDEFHILRVLANVTDLGLMAKVGDASSLVWVVRLSDGQPVSGARVTLRDLKGKIRYTATSNTDGVVQAPGASKLLDLKPRPRGTGEDHDEVYEESLDPGAVNAGIVVKREYLDARSAGW
jgi:hypothetical protein